MPDANADGAFCICTLDICAVYGEDFPYFFLRWQKLYHWCDALPGKGLGGPVVGVVGDIILCSGPSAKGKVEYPSG
jgi:hypothetical protein